MLLEILQFPDGRLRRKAQPVAEVDRELRHVIDSMFETMYDAPGVGLAAIQVDVPKRMVVIDVSEGRDAPLCLVNPEIVSRDGVEETEEGCLSVPGIFEPVARAQRVTVRALDVNGKPFQVEASGLLAVCIQHEVDHLNGKLFVDYLSPMKVGRIRKKLEKRRRQGPVAL
jgi:peptide deformylase